MAADSRGNVHVVWEDDTPGNYEILCRRWNSGGWAKIENLSQNSGISGSPAIAADSRGNVHVVWQDYTPGNYEIFYRRWSAGGGWSPIENLSRNGGTSATPAIAAGPEGSVHVVWRDYTPGESGILYRQWNGISWSPKVALTPGSATSGSPAVAADAAGKLHFAWVDENPSNYEIFYRRWSAGGGWSPVENLSNNTWRSVSPAIAASPGGDVHVVWQDCAPGNWEILYRRWSSGVWSEAENLSQDTGTSGSPALAADAAGNVHVVWTDDTPGNYQISSRRWIGGAWSETESISENRRFSWAPAVAAGPSGASHVVWEDSTPGNFDIFYTGPALSPASPPTPTPIPTPTATPMPSPNQIQLSEGWNLISVPGPLQDPSVGAVFAQVPALTRVFTCVGESWTDASRGNEGWQGILTQIANGQGYFVYATAPATLALALKPADALAVRPSYPLAVGWSLIGYTAPSLSPTASVAVYLNSLDGKWTSLYRFDATKGWEIARPGDIGFAEMERGRGYWISVRSAGTLAP